MNRSNSPPKKEGPIHRQEKKEAKESQKHMGQRTKREKKTQVRKNGGGQEVDTGLWGKKKK